MAWTTSTLLWPLSGSRLRPIAGWWCTGCSHPATDLLPAVGGTFAPLAVAEALLYAGHFLAAGSCRLLLFVPPLARCYLPGNRATLHIHHIPHGGAHHQPCSGRIHTDLRLSTRPPHPRVEGGPTPSWRGLLLGFLRGRGELKYRIGGVADDVVVVRSSLSGREISQTSQAHAHCRGMDMSPNRFSVAGKRLSGISVIIAVYG